MPNVIISPAAREDLRLIKKYITKDSKQAAFAYIKLLHQKFLILSESPQIGREDETYLGLTRFPVGNYLIFYRKKAQGIEVARVLHAARDIEKILKNDKDSR